MGPSISASDGLTLERDRLSCGTRAGARFPVPESSIWATDTAGGGAAGAAPSRLCPTSSSARRPGFSAPVNLLRVGSREKRNGSVYGAGARSLRYREAARCGIATGYLAEFSGDAAAKALIVDDLLWSDLESEERVRVMRNLWHKARLKERKSRSPLLGYAKPLPLRTVGFRQSRRLIESEYLTVWGGVPLPARSHIDLSGIVY